MAERGFGRDGYFPLEQQAADALRRARKLPVGPDRNDLRQLAVGLLWLHRNGMDALLMGRAQSIRPLTEAISADGVNPGATDQPTALC